MKTQQTYQQKIARLLLDIGALKFRPDDPFVFRTGVASPIYVDNRLILSHPKALKQVIETFAQVIKNQKITFDVIAGMESTGMNFSSILAFYLEKPAVFVRRSQRDYGTKEQVEGESVEDKLVLIIQDTVTTGLSLVKTAQALRQRGARVTNCLAIEDKDFVEADLNAEAAGLNLQSLTTFPDMMKVAKKIKLYTNNELKIIEDWYRNPNEWSRKRGFGSAVSGKKLF